VDSSAEEVSSARSPGDARSFAFPDAVGSAVFLVCTAAEFAFDLDMRAALQGTSEFGEFRPANDAVPLGAGGPLTGLLVLPRCLGGYGEDREGSAFRAELLFSVFADESDE
jgi:hypothetical protein